MSAETARKMEMNRTLVGSRGPHTPRFLIPRCDSSRFRLRGSGLEHLSLDLNPDNGSIAGGTEELCHLACFGVTKALPGCIKSCVGSVLLADGLMHAVLTLLVELTVFHSSSNPPPPRVF
jgi:hypothetical protein